MKRLCEHHLWAVLSSALAMASCSAPGDAPVVERSSGALNATRIIDPATGCRVPQDGSETLQYSTGARAATPEERADAIKTERRLVGVRPTPLAIERLRRHAARVAQQRQAGRNANGALSAPPAPDLSRIEQQTVPVGDDLVTEPVAGAPAPAAGDVALYAAPSSETVALAAGELPRAVDNSELPAFPEIRSQGGIGSCMSFATAYYQYTHEVGLLAGWNNKNSNDATKISPKWAYDLNNLGGDGGSSSLGVYRTFEQHGALTWAEFPYVGDGTNPLNYREWPRGAQTWRNALRFKASAHGELALPTTPYAMEQVKSMLLNGHVLVISTYIGSWKWDFVDNDPNTPDDDAFADQQILTLVDGSQGAHGLTIVGYNDDIWVDYNNNGQVDAGEKGAFKVANSWGEWWNGGYAWIAYDAVNRSPTANCGVASASRQPAMLEVSWIAARANYQPDVVAEITLTAVDRSGLALEVSTSEPDRTTPLATWAPWAFQHSGGRFAFDGTSTTQPQTASFALDLTEMAPSYADLRFSVKATNSSTNPAGLSGMALTDRLKPGVRIVSTDPAVTLNQNESKAQTARYKFVDPARVPRLVATPSPVDFGNVALGTAGTRSLALSNTGTGDVLLYSFGIDLPLFGTSTAVPLTIKPGEQASFNLQFAPIGAQSEAGNLTLRSNNATQTTTSVALRGAGTSSNDAAPFLLYMRQQNAANDNSIGMRFDLVSHAPMPARISDYKIVYYINEPNLDLTQLAWDTYWTNARTPIGFAARKLFFNNKILGPRKANTAIELTFPEGTTIYPGQSLTIEGNLHRGDWQWQFDETDDWSRYVRRDGLAENMLVQKIESRGMVFGSSPEGSIPGTYLLTVTPAQVTSDATVTFVINDASLVGQFIPIEIHRDGSFLDYRIYRVSATGPQTYPMSFSGFSPGNYAIVLKINGAMVDSFEVKKI